MANIPPPTDDGREPRRDVRREAEAEGLRSQQWDPESPMPHGTDPQTQMPPQGRLRPRWALPLAILIIVVIVIWALAV